MKTTTVASKKKSPKAPIFAPSILAIDLGKYKSVASALDPESGECQYRNGEKGRIEKRGQRTFSLARKRPPLLRQYNSKSTVSPGM